MRYKHSLDGVRALCIIFTMLNHTKGLPYFFSGLNFGVDIFFALSGFLITTLIINEIEVTGNLDLKGFYYRRLFRIVPLYYLTVLLYAVVIKLGLVNKSFEQNYICFFYLITFNREYYFNTNGVFGHAWTLGIEEKFYIFLPLVVFLVIKFKWKIIPFIFWILLMFMFFVLSDFEVGVLRGYFGIIVGSGLAYMTHKYLILKDYFKKNHSSIISFIGIVVGFLVLAVYNLRIGNFICSFFGAFLVACLWNNEESTLSRLLDNRFFRFTGKLTYSIYLIHVLVINFVQIFLNKFNIHLGLVTFFISYLVSVICSFFLNKYIEKKFILVGKQIASKEINV